MGSSFPNIASTCYNKFACVFTLGNNGSDLAQREGCLALASVKTYLGSLSLSLISVGDSGRDVAQRGGRLAVADDSRYLRSLGLSLISAVSSWQFPFILAAVTCKALAQHLADLEKCDDAYLVLQLH